MRASIWRWGVAFGVAGLVLVGDAEVWRWWHTLAAGVAIVAAMRITALADRLAETPRERARW